MDVNTAPCIFPICMLQVIQVHAVPLKCERYSLKSEILDKAQNLQYILTDYFLLRYILATPMDRDVYGLEVLAPCIMQVHVLPLRCENVVSEILDKKLKICCIFQQITFFCAIFWQYQWTGMYMVAICRPLSIISNPLGRSLCVVLFWHFYANGPEGVGGVIISDNVLFFCLFIGLSPYHAARPAGPVTICPTRCCHPRSSTVTCGMFEDS